jgi:serine racemase
VDVIAGQGTIALEFLQQVPLLDALIVPVGGGGMLSGICIAAKALKPSIRIFAAEPLAANDCAESIQAGERRLLKGTPQTVADGLRTSLGEITWPIIKENVEEVLTVTEEDIIRYMKLVWERMKICIESSAAVGVAAVMSEQFQELRKRDQNTDRPLKRVGIVLCGGNVDLDALPWLNVPKEQSR